MILHDNCVITSRQNPLVVRFSKLCDKKYRAEENLFLIVGAKLFCEAAKKNIPIKFVLLRDGCENELTAQTLENIKNNPTYGDTEVVRFSESAFEKFCDEKSPDGVVCVLPNLDFFQKYNRIDEKRAADIYAGEKIMLLSSIRDSGNLGTIVRDAVAFSFDRLIISSDCAELCSPKTMRGAMGALFSIKVDITDDLESAVASLKSAGRRVFASELRNGAMPLDSIDLVKSDCFVIGNEGHGISPEVSHACTGSVFIPISENSESLNAAAAAAILAFAQR